jgi:hypothetical protein
MRLEFSRQIFGKITNIKFHQDPSIGNQVVSCGQTDGQMDMTKLIVAFRNFANARKNLSNGFESVDSVWRSWRDYETLWIGVLQKLKVPELLNRPSALQTLEFYYSV